MSRAILALTRDEDPLEDAAGADDDLIDSIEAYARTEIDADQGLDDDQITDLTGVTGVTGVSVVGIEGDTCTWSLTESAAVLGGPNATEQALTDLSDLILDGSS